MQYNKIYADVRDLLAPYAETAGPIGPDTLLVDDLGLDSMQVMEVLMELEDRFDTAIPTNFLPDIQTVDELVKALQPLLGNQSEVP